MISLSSYTSMSAIEIRPGIVVSVGALKPVVPGSFLSRAVVMEEYPLARGTFPNEVLV